jgi:PAS domain S-box-containing protein
MFAETCALVVLVFCLVVLIELLTGIPFDIEQLFLGTASRFGLVPIGRMSPITAVALVLAGASLVISSSASGDRRRQLAAILALLAASIGFVIILGYLFGAPLLYGTSTIPVALTTAIALDFLGIGVCASAGPTCWPMRIVIGPSLNAQLLRGFLPLIVAIVLFLGWFYGVGVSWIGNPALTASLALFFALITVITIASRTAREVGEEIDQTHDALRESEQRFRRITDNMLDVIAQTDLLGTCQYASPSMKTVLGYDPKDMLGKSMFEYVHPDDFDNVLDIVRKALFAVTTGRFEYRYRHADGHYVWLESGGNPLFDEKGQMIGAVLSSRDITERKRIELALRERMKELSCLYGIGRSVELSDSSLDGIMGEVVSIIPPAYEYPDVACARIVLGNQMFESAGFKESRWSQSADIRVLGNTAGRVEVYYLEEKPTSSEGPFLKEERDLIDTIAERLGRVVERKKMEDSLRESEEKYRALVENASDFIFMMDGEGRVLSLNKAAARLFRREPEEAVGKSIFDLFPNEIAAGYSRSLKEVFRTGESMTAESRMIAEGEEMWIAARINPVRSLEGKVLAVMGVATDITERKKIERMKDQFVSMVSHELRTPLTSIRASLGLLASGVIGALPEKGQRMLEIAVTNTDRLVRLINDILDSERLASAKTPMEKKLCGAVQLVTQAADVMKPMAEKAGVSLSAESQDAELWADPDRIVQALTNLISNAIKFSQKGGKIRVTAEHKENQMLFRVQDEGRGIPPDKLGLLFERFQQLDSSDARERGGSGLGLSISRSIIEQHNGKIWVESTVGKGSTFFFTVPLLLEAQVPLQPEATTGAPSTRKALIIEDDPDLANILAAMLERHNIQSHIVLTGGKGIALSKQMHPDLIVLDLILPDMDGSIVVEDLRKDNILRSVPLVVYTVKELDEQQRENLRLGETLFFTKSRIPPEQFEEKVVQFMERIFEDGGSTGVN